MYSHVHLHSLLSLVFRKWTSGLFICDGRKVVEKQFIKHDDQVDRSKQLPYDFSKATEAIDTWSFCVILYMLYTKSPLFEVNRDDDINTPEAKIGRFELEEKKKLAKLEKVNDPSARKLLMKILLRNPSERYQSLDELLGNDYFGSDDRTKPVDRESGVATPEPGIMQTQGSSLSF